MIESEAKFGIKMHERKTLGEFHTGCVRGLVWFPWPINRLITGALDGQIIVFNESFERVGSFKHSSNAQKSPVYHIIKMKENIFMTCGEDGRIRAFRVGPELPFELVREWDMMKLCDKSDDIYPDDYFQVFSMLKLSNDYFLSLSGDYEKGLLSVVKYKETESFRALKPQKSWDSKLFLSKNYSDCFFMTLGNERKTVKMINYETNKELFEFVRDTENGRLLLIDTFIDRKGTEILVVGGASSILYFYKIVVKGDETKMKEESFFWSYQPGNDHKDFFTSYILKNRFMLIGSKLGTFSICLLNSKSKGKGPYSEEFDNNCPVKIGEEKAASLVFEKKDTRENKPIWSILVLESECRRGKVVVATGSDDFSVRILEIEGLNVFDDYEDEDLKERVLFLKEDHDIYTFGNQEIFCKLALSNVEIVGIFKSLIL